MIYALQNKVITVLESQYNKNMVLIIRPLQNNYNKSIQKRNTSGYKGVGFDKRRNKQVASVKKNGKSYYLGGFTDKQEAIRVRQLKANELFKSTKL